MHRAGAIVQAGYEDLFHSESLDAHTGAHDVRDRIERTHFVEVHLFHRLAMDFPLGLGDAMKDRQRVLLDKLRKFAIGDQLADLPVIAAVRVLVVMVAAYFRAVIMIADVPMSVVLVLMLMLVMLMRVFVFMMPMLVTMFLLFAVVMVLMAVLVSVRMLMGMLVLVSMPMAVFVFMFVMVVALAMLALLLVPVVRVGRAFVDAEFHTLHLLPLLAVEVHVEIAEIELRELPFESGRLDTEVDEGAHGHVAGDPGKTVEEEDFHISKCWKRWSAGRSTRAGSGRHRRALCR